MKYKSAMFTFSKPGTKGRRLTRNLNDDAVERAKEKSKDQNHQQKFMTPGQRMTVAVRRKCDKEWQESK